jgi:hypothetical protein
MRFLRTNTAVIITVGPFYDKTDGVTIETALTITNERITLTADTDAGSAPTNILDNVTGATAATANDLNYITGNDAGLMQLELAAADVNRLGRMFLSITDAANHVPVFHEFMVLPAMIYDAFVLGTDVLDASITQLLGTAIATPTVGGVLEVDLTHVAGATTNVAALATNVDAILADTAVIGATGAGLTSLASQASVNTIDDFLDSEVAAILAAVDTEIAAILADTNELQIDWANGGRLDLLVDAILEDTGTTLDARIPAALVSGKISAHVGTGGLNAASIAVDTGLKPLHTGTVDGVPTATTVPLAATASDTDQTYTGAVFLLASGLGAGQAPRIITNYNGTTKVATVTPAFGTTPDAESAYAILPHGSVSLEAIQRVAVSSTVAQLGTNVIQVGGTVQTAGDVVAALTTIDDFLDTEVAAILVDTGATLDDFVDDLETRLTQALADKLAAHALAVLTLVVAAGSTTTAVVFGTVNGATASATNDFYNGRVIVFTSGALAGQATSITDYVGATKTATVVALTGAPADTVTAVIV